nr:uncharacterized protein LOC111416629 isoform X1 [Onthophagus taurus]
MKIIILFCVFFVMVWSYPANEEILPASIDNIANTELVLLADEIDVDGSLETSETRNIRYRGGGSPRQPQPRRPQVQQQQRFGK